MKTADLIEDVQDLIAAGEWPDRIAARLGYKNRDSLTTALNRRGRHDLAVQVRLLDHTTVEYQLAHYTPMDEVVARDKQRYLAKKKAARDAA